MKFRRIISVFFILLAVLFVFPMSLKALENIQVGSSTRTMIVYAPENLPEKSALVLSLHGMDQDAAYQQNMAQWEPIADTEKFVVVYPNGINKAWDLSGNSDINFMQAIIDEMAVRYKIDINRVYLSGFSMGGMFTYYAMTKMADMIAAFAPISGYPMGSSSFTSARPVPIIHTHGTTDGVVVYSGVQSRLDGWIARNNCPTIPVVTDPYPSSNPNSSAAKSYWGPGDNGVEVVLITLKGKGHWVSIDPINAVNTSLEIWNFCKNYSLNLKHPQVKIVSPLNNSLYTSLGETDVWQNILVEATATDPDGTIEKVEFYLGNTLLFSDEEAPFSFNMTNVPSGAQTIKVIATDNEGNIGQSSIKVQVNTMAQLLNLSANFTSGGIVPSGWTTFDGATLRVGPLSGLTSGCRVFQFTGTQRDFNYGLYFRNTTGAAKSGYAAYGLTGSGALLYLAAGNYQLAYTCANWNMAQNGDIICSIESTEAKLGIASQTIKPVANIGNSASNSFSGSTVTSLTFNVELGGQYSVNFYTADGAWADGVIANVSLSPANATEVGNPVFDKTVKETRYFNMLGVEIYQEPIRGLVIKQIVYSDGSFNVVKYYKK